MAEREVRVGTSGWVYSSWRARFYPEKLAQRQWLRFYCTQYVTVELNCTFYRLPTEAAVRAWAETAPPAFLFAAKGNRYITHRLLLREADAPLQRFLERIGLLGEHLGPILWQLPPSFAQDKATLESFLQLLPTPPQHAFEFRHLSWYYDSVLALLAAGGHALCLHDWGQRAWPKVTTTSWTYIRLHSGSGPDGAYTDSELREWANWLADCLETGLGAAYVYFNNDAMANAIANARSLTAMVQELCPGAVLTPGLAGPSTLRTGLLE